MNLASRTNRFFGQMIDGVVGSAPMILAALVAALSGKLSMLLMIAGACWAVFYIFLADGMNNGMSYGKKWLGMQVISEKTGEPCTYGQSFVRNLLQVFLGPLDWIFIFGERRQRLGDKAAGTIVIED